MKVGSLKNEAGVGYLPLSGGNMTGEIQRSGIGMANRTAGQFLAFYGGATGTDGAALFLEDKANESFPGYFILRAANGEQTQDLIGYPDGRLKFGSKFVFPTETFGTSGYFKLPGGTIVQYGQVVTSADSNVSVVTLPVAYTTRVNSVLANCGETNTPVAVSNSLSTITLTIPSAASGTTINWLTVGY